MRRLLLLAALGAARAEAQPDAQPEAEEPPYQPPQTVEGAQFYEPFLDGWDSRWVISKDAEFKGRWKLETYSPDSLVGDKGLVVSDAAQRHAISTTFAPLDPKGTGLVVQYELQLKNGLQCGGAYLKLLTASDELSLDGFHASTPYTIMFGPDRCGDTNKVHFILRHKNPISNEWEEKHLTTPPIPDTSDKLTHLYTAIVGTDNTVKILVDNEEKRSASLLSRGDFQPPINPTKEIADPSDTKPADWVDEATIDDPSASKPDDWDEDAPRTIADPDDVKPSGWLDDAPLKALRPSEPRIVPVPDPEGKQPADWDEEEDGEWEAPLVDNPACKAAGCGEWKILNPDYKGKWHAPKIDNPAYKGIWEPRQIPNPNYFEDPMPHAMAPIGGIGIELWTMQNGILFDNILVSTDPAAAASLAAGTFMRRSELEKAAKKKVERNVPKGEGFVGKVKEYGTKLLYFIQDYPLAVGLSVCLGLLPLLLYLCWPSKSNGAEESIEEEDIDYLAEEHADPPLESDEPEMESEEETPEEAPAEVAHEPEAESSTPEKAASAEKNKEEKPSATKSSARKRTPKAS